MKAAQFILTLLVVAVRVILAADCDPHSFVDECVTYYQGGNCQDGNELGSFKPTCEGNCFQFSSFDSIEVQGNSNLGTDCHVFSDPFCENQIGDTGNVVTASCGSFQGAQSMICFFDCFRN